MLPCSSNKVIFQHTLGNMLPSVCPAQRTVYAICVVCYVRLHYWIVHYTSHIYPQGSAFRDQIITAMQNNTFFTNVMLPYNATEAGSRLYSSYYKVVFRTFPEFLQEIAGMANGANISFSEVCKCVGGSYTVY